MRNFYVGWRGASSKRAGRGLKWRCRPTSGASGYCELTRFASPLTAYRPPVRRCRHLQLKVMEIDAYLKRIGYRGSRQPTAETLRQLHRLTGSDSERVLQRWRESEYESRYVFSLTPRRLTEFSAMCQRQQTSSESIFARKSVCSLATLDGRITLSNSRLIVTAGERREEREVADEQEYRALLETHFGIDLKEEARVDRLMVPVTPSN